MINLIFPRIWRSRYHCWWKITEAARGRNNIFLRIIDAHARQSRTIHSTFCCKLRVPGLSWTFVVCSLDMHDIFRNVGWFWLDIHDNVLRCNFYFWLSLLMVFLAATTLFCSRADFCSSLRHNAMRSMRRCWNSCTKIVARGAAR